MLLSPCLRTAIYFFFSEACACDFCGQSCFPFSWRLLPISSRCSLRPLILSSSLKRCQSVQVYPHHPAFLISGGRSSQSGWCSYIPGFCCVCSLFFHFGGGQPLQSVQSLPFHSSMENSTACFTTSSTMVFLKILPDVLALLRHSCTFKPQSVIP